MTTGTTNNDARATALSAIADPDERWTLVGDRLERWSERRDYSVREETYRRLKRAIVQCAIEPGAALSEQELSEQLAVSRTPVREALLRLSDDGLVVIAPQRGTITTKISVRQVREAQLVREVLERSVLALAAQRPELATAGVLDRIIAEQWRAAAEQDYSAFLDADLSFHAAIGALSGLDGVTRLATTARAHLDRVRALSLPETHLVESRIRDHEAILEALRAGDLKSADALLTDHLRSVLEILPAMRERHPDYFAPEGDVEPDRPGIAITLETPSR